MKDFLIISQIEKETRLQQIDFIKALAIISVIMLHTIPGNKRLTILAPFHIWHAIPIFMVIAGITSTISSTKHNSILSLSNEYSIGKLKKYSKRILIPFTFIWLVEIIIMAAFKGTTLRQILISYFVGGIGPGSYFIPIFIQHLLCFPLILWLFDTFSHHRNIILFLLFAFSIFAEWLCIQANVSDSLYILLYVRYIFAVAIGVFIARYGLQPRVLFLSLFSAAYITIVSYLKINVDFIYPSWGFQHAPAYFYTALLIIILWNFYPYLKKIGLSLNYIGRSSYHIFLFQMLYFWTLSHRLLHIVRNPFVWLILNIFICISIGCLFFKIEQLINSSGKWEIANESLPADRKKPRPLKSTLLGRYNTSLP
jgi:hypothetical protein